MLLPSDNNSDRPQSGNLFGWRISLIGLTLILVLTALAAYRHYTMDVPVGFTDPLAVPDARGYYQEKADRERAHEDSLRLQKQPD